MVQRIRVLPEEIAQTIAAGEVVERPASVVKELMENAIDAGATQILVELKAGGLELIRVRDNGRGIEEEDVPVALERYATSKIEKTEDLFALHTLGFRGEALPSIASVSRMVLTTRVRESLHGTRLACEGGAVKEIRQVGCPIGTEVEVDELFYNIPVKRKFLKSIRSELHQVIGHFLRLALAYPRIAARLTHDGRPLYDLLRSESEGVRVEAVLGREIFRQLQPFEWDDGEIRISGFASHPSLVKTNADNLYLYVNGRWARDRIVHRAILEAYRRVIPEAKFPVVLLRMVVPPSFVDVNVHPTKAEVKFREPDRIFQVVQRALKALHAPVLHAPRLDVTAVPAAIPVKDRPKAETVISAAFDFGAVSVVREPAVPAWGNDPSIPYRVLGQVHGTFLVCEGEAGLVLVDQHAAHERILFEKFKREYEARSTPVVQLLLPILMETTAEESFLLSSFLENFLSLGFEIDRVGEKTFAVRALPSGIDERLAEDMIKEILEALRLSNRAGKGTDTVDTILVLMACHRALRAGQPLRNEEMARLLKDLLPFPPYSTCPHGRPIFVSLSWEELNRQFKRNS
jgi:DNA mismatch repair protein MutL